MHQRAGSAAARKGKKEYGIPQGHSHSSDDQTPGDLEGRDALLTEADKMLVPTSSAPRNQAAASCNLSAPTPLAPLGQPTRTALVNGSWVGSGTWGLLLLVLVVWDCQPENEFLEHAG